jgi:HD-like signal output (HDOD) protein
VFFKGDLNKFYQPDLIMFLANLGKEGVLTVTHGELSLNISIKKGVITDAFSDRADGKILHSLLFRGLIDDRQMAKINQMKRETGMQAVHILDKLNLVDKEEILPEAQMAIREVLLQFFLMESGKFQFLNVVVEAGGQSVPCQGILLDMARQVDEWRYLEKGQVPMDRVVVSRIPETALERAPYPARHILAAAAQPASVAQIVETVSMYSFDALKIVSQALSKNLVKIKEPSDDVVTGEKPSAKEMLLKSFKKSYGHILKPRGGEAKIDRLVSFCKYYFDQTAVLTVRGDRIVRCVSHFRDAAGNEVEKDSRDLGIPMADGEIVSGVHRSGVAFFGKLDFSDILGRLLALPPSGECALIQVERSPEESQLLFALSIKESGYAFQYLKFFSEMMESAEDGAYGKQLVSVSERATRLVSEIDDIPPMSRVVTRVLQLLSDPEKSLNDLAVVLAEDQAMVARIIRVSNSTLYRSLEDTRSLDKALARLGIRAIRSILLTSATRDLLMSDKSAGGMWSRFLWQHAKECAMASRRIAERVKYPDPEEAFVGGMLHDIGKMVILLKHRNLLQQIRKLQVGENLGSVEAERFVLGFSHPELGGLLMEKWHMPEILNTCVQYHHQPGASGGNTQLTRIVAYGNCLSNLNGVNESVGADRYAKEIEAHRRHFNLEGAAEALEGMIIEDFRQMDVLD